MASTSPFRLSLARVRDNVAVRLKITILKRELHGKIGQSTG